MRHLHAASHIDIFMPRTKPDHSHEGRALAVLSAGLVLGAMTAVLAARAVRPPPGSAGHAESRQWMSWDGCKQVNAETAASEHGQAGRGGGRVSGWVMLLHTPRCRRQGPKSFSRGNLLSWQAPEPKMDPSGATLGLIKRSLFARL